LLLEEGKRVRRAGGVPFTAQGGLGSRPTSRAESVVGSPGGDAEEKVAGLRESDIGERLIPALEEHADEQEQQAKEEQVSSPHGGFVEVFQGRYFSPRLFVNRWISRRLSSFNLVQDGSEWADPLIPRECSFQTLPSIQLMQETSVRPLENHSCIYRKTSLSKLKSTVYEELPPIPTRMENKLANLLNEEPVPLEPTVSAEAAEEARKDEKEKKRTRLRRRKRRYRPSNSRLSRKRSVSSRLESRTAMDEELICYSLVRRKGSMG
jgi:hypothetical protein